VPKNKFQLDLTYGKTLEIIEIPNLFLQLLKPATSNVCNMIDSCELMCHSSVKQQLRLTSVLQHETTNATHYSRCN